MAIGGGTPTDLNVRVVLLLEEMLRKLDGTFKGIQSRPLKIPSQFDPSGLVGGVNKSSKELKRTLAEAAKGGAGSLQEAINKALGLVKPSVQDVGASVTKAFSSNPILASIANTKKFQTALVAAAAGAGSLPEIMLRLGNSIAKTKEEQEAFLDVTRKLTIAEAEGKRTRLGTALNQLTGTKEVQAAGSTSGKKYEAAETALSEFRSGITSTSGDLFSFGSHILSNSQHVSSAFNDLSIASQKFGGGLSGTLKALKDGEVAGNFLGSLAKVAINTAGAMLAIGDAGVKLNRSIVAVDAASGKYSSDIMKAISSGSPQAMMDAMSHNTDAAHKSRIALSQMGTRLNMSAEDIAGFAGTLVQTGVRADKTGQALDLQTAAGRNQVNQLLVFQKMTGISNDALGSLSARFQAIGGRSANVVKSLATMNVAAQAAGVAPAIMAEEISAVSEGLEGMNVNIDAVIASQAEGIGIMTKLGLSAKTASSMMQQMQSSAQNMNMSQLAASRYFMESSGFTAEINEKIAKHFGTTVDKLTDAEKFEGLQILQETGEEIGGLPASMQMLLSTMKRLGQGTGGERGIGVMAMVKSGQLAQMTGLPQQVVSKFHRMLMDKKPIEVAVAQYKKDMAEVTAGKGVEKAGEIAGKRTERMAGEEVPGGDRSEPPEAKAFEAATKLLTTTSEGMERAKEAAMQAASAPIVITGVGQFNTATAALATGMGNLANEYPKTVAALTALAIAAGAAGLALVKDLVVGGIKKLVGMVAGGGGIPGLQGGPPLAGGEISSMGAALFAPASPLALAIGATVAALLIAKTVYEGVKFWQAGKEADKNTEENKAFVEKFSGEGTEQDKALQKLASGQTLTDPRERTLAQMGMKAKLTSANVKTSDMNAIVEKMMDPKMFRDKWDSTLDKLEKTKAKDQESAGLWANTKAYFGGEGPTVDEESLKKNEEERKKALEETYKDLGIGAPPPPEKKAPEPAKPDVAAPSEKLTEPAKPPVAVAAEKLIGVPLETPKPATAEQTISQLTQVSNMDSISKSMTDAALSIKEAAEKLTAAASQFQAAVQSINLSAATTTKPATAGAAATSPAGVSPESMEIDQIKQSDAQWKAGEKRYKERLAKEKAHKDRIYRLIHGAKPAGAAGGVIDSGLIGTLATKAVEGLSAIGGSVVSMAAEQVSEQLKAATGEDEAEKAEATAEEIEARKKEMAIGLRAASMGRSRELLMTDLAKKSYDAETKRIATLKGRGALPTDLKELAKMKEQAKAAGVSMEEFSNLSPAAKELISKTKMMGGKFAENKDESTPNMDDALSAAGDKITEVFGSSGDMMNDQLMKMFGGGLFSSLPMPDFSEIGMFDKTATVPEYPGSESEGTTPVLINFSPNIEIELDTADPAIVSKNILDKLLPAMTEAMSRATKERENRTNSAHPTSGS